MNTIPYLIDSHCHLDRLELSKHDGDLSLALDMAKQNGVGHMLCVSIGLKDYPAMLEKVMPFPQVSVSVGVHPNEQDGIEPTVDMLVDMAKNKKVVAIGETGLDYFRSEGDLDWQRDRFRVHIEASKQTGKPLIIHTREAREDTLAIMKSEKANEAGGVMHCFAEDWETAKQALDLGFYISFSGIVTFKNAKDLQEVAKKVPLDKMLVETDSPYLAPVPNRGKPNEPAYVLFVAEKIAELRGMSLEEVASITTNNYKQLFKWDSTSL
ncbi:MAG: TatD family hydrolase [Gammaproteobacteria bacterium]|nr:TatD family hydrolase [Gammaproteobacteria bacterium]